MTASIKNMAALRRAVDRLVQAESGVLALYLQNQLTQPRPQDEQRAAVLKEVLAALNAPPSSELIKARNDYWRAFRRVQNPD